MYTLLNDSTVAYCQVTARIQIMVPPTLAFFSLTSVSQSSKSKHYCFTQIQDMLIVYHRNLEIGQHCYKNTSCIVIISFQYHISCGTYNQHLNLNLGEKLNFPPIDIFRF